MASRTRQMLATIIARFAGKTVNFVVFAILARTLSLAELGVYGFIFTVSLLFATAFDVGVRNSVAKFIGLSDAQKADYALQSALLFVPFALACAGCLVGFYMWQRLDVPLEIVLVPALVNTISLLFIRMEQGILIGLGRIDLFNRTELAPRLLLLVGTLGLLFSDALDLQTALYVLALSNLAGALVVAVGVFPAVTGGSFTSFSCSRALVRRGFVFMLSVVAMLLAKQMAFFILTQLGGEGQAGQFFGVRRLTEILTEIGLAVSVVLFSHNVRTKDRAEAIAAAAHSTRVSFLFFLFLAAGGAIFAPYVLQLALGSGFAGESTLFRIILLGTLLGTIWIILYPSLTAIDEPIVAFLIFLPNLLVGAGLTWWLYGIGGITGVAWAMVVAQLLLSVSFLLAFRLRHGAHIGQFLILQREDVAGIAAKLRRKGQAV